LYCGVDMRKVVEVPRLTIASELRSGNARMVDGLSPVKAIISVSDEKLYRLTKYEDMVPKLSPPS
jgi:hypothetical protein